MKKRFINKLKAKKLSSFTENRNYQIIDLDFRFRLSEEL